MAAEVDTARMQEEVSKLLKSVELAKVSVGSMRADLEARLGLAPGALDSRKEEVTTLLEKELMSLLEQGAVKAGDAEEPAKKKQKKEKKEKKDKKDKKDKNKKDNSSDEAAPAPAVAASPSPAASAAPAPAVAASPSPAASAAPAEPAAPAVPAAPMTPEDFPDDKAVVAAAPGEEASLAVRSKTSGWAVSGGEDSSLRLWDLSSGACDQVLEGHLGAVAALDVHWEEMQAVSGAADGARLWDLRKGACLKCYVCSGKDDTGGGCAAVSADWQGTKEKCVLGGFGDGMLRLWEMESGELRKEIMAHPGGVWALEVGWSQLRVASGGDEHLKIWDTEDWTLLQQLDGHPGGIVCLAAEWSRHRVLVGAGDSLRLWDYEDKTNRSFIGHRDVVSGLRLKLDGKPKDKVAVTGSWDAQIRLWSISSQSTLSHVDCKFGRVRSLAVDFEGMQAICGASNGLLHQLDLQNGKEVRSLEGHVGAVTALQARL